MRQKTLKNIFGFNVMRFGRSDMGATNGLEPDGVIIANTEHNEVWVGTTIGYVALATSNGPEDQA